MFAGGAIRRCCDDLAMLRFGPRLGNTDIAEGIKSHVSLRTCFSEAPHKIHSSFYIQAPHSNNDLHYATTLLCRYATAS